MTTKLDVNDSPPIHLYILQDDPIHMDSGDIVVDYPPYQGPYTAIPSDTQQALNTKGKVLGQDIIIKPVPKNYGLITWNGSYLVIS